MATFAAIAAPLGAVHYGQLSHRAPLPILAPWIVGRGRGCGGFWVLFQRPVMHRFASQKSLCFRPPLAPSFNGFLCSAICLREMESQRLRHMLTSLASTSRLAVELFLKIQSESESEESDDAIEPCNGYDTKLLVAFTDMLSTVERCFWARETSTEWWDHIVMEVWDDEQWLQNFLMRKATFMGHALTLRRKHPRLRAALPVEKRVAIAIWKLATPDSYWSVANQFGVGKSTVGIVLMQVCRAINRILLRRTVTLGNVQDIVDGFAQMGFPNCRGAIDGTHIRILAPPHLASEYVNWKGYFSMVLQALVDHRGHFIDINTGWPGKMDDARIFWNTWLFRKIQAGTFFPEQKITVGEVEMPIVILGVPAYPLMPWLMKPCTGSLDSSKERFKYRLSRCRMTGVCLWPFKGPLAISVWEAGLGQTQHPRGYIRVLYPP
ncbi:signal peptidase complex catalytic subunit SEC11A isoform X1 [Chrysemys picta bellii]|uniref:signal peptidase complex catalytic subunit SEC11A isoform X1 n=1 Tax=Chrysemys picta bellii TaxID=8478 RepID=UPI0032B2F4BA